MPGILNAVTNVAAGVATFQSLGTNKTLAAPSTSILGVGVPGIPLISFRDYFLTTMESWITSILVIHYKMLWVVYFYQGLVYQAKL